MNDKMLGLIWVVLQFGLLLALGVLCLGEVRYSLPGPLSWALWFFCALLGVWTLRVNRPGNFNIRPEPRRDGQLVQEGPYKWVRHPMYGAVLLLGAGASTWFSDATGWLLWIALLGVLIAKARLEEKWLLCHYPEYEAYRLRTWKMVPWIY